MRRRLGATFARGGSASGRARRWRSSGVPSGRCREASGPGRRMRASSSSERSWSANSVGEILDEDDSILVGPKLEPGERREDLVEQLGTSAAANTTLGVVATNAALSKEDVRRLASVGNDAFDVAIRPAHTIYDGDTVFALATQQVAASVRAGCRIWSSPRSRPRSAEPSLGSDLASIRRGCGRRSRTRR